MEAIKGRIPVNELETSNQLWQRTGPRGGFTQCPLQGAQCIVGLARYLLPGPLHAALGATKRCYRFCHLRLNEGNHAA
jgi:hypothetical protein